MRGLKEHVDEHRSKCSKVGKTLEIVARFLGGRVGAAGRVAGSRWRIEAHPVVNKNPKTEMTNHG
jgi:hypothetical protein